MKNGLVSRNLRISPFVLAFLISGVFIMMLRLIINFSSPLMPGTNGAYYLIQAKSVIQTGSLAFADTPLVFWLEGGLAWLVNLFVNNIDVSVTFSVKLLDSLLPVLVGFPIAYVLAKKNTETNVFNGVSIVLMVSLHLFGLMMVSELQKNSLGNVMMMFAICSFYLGVGEKKVLYHIAGLAFFVLTALAHIGSFSVLVVLLFVFIISYVIIDIRKLVKKWLFAVVLLIALVLVIIAALLIMPEKFGFLKDVLDLPFKLFSNSWLNSAFAFLSVPGARFPFIEFLSLAINHLIVAISLVSLKRTWLEKDNMTKASYISLAFAILFFSSPLISQEYAQRLFMVSYIPAVALALVFLLDANKKVSTMPMFAWMTVFTCISLLSMLQFKPMPAISQAQFFELKDFGQKVEGQKAIVVTKHGLEWWVGWVTGKPVLQQYHITSSIWNEYESVLYMKSVGQQNPNSSTPQQFMEVDVPKDAVELYKGQTLQVFKVSTPQNTSELGFPDAKGVVVESMENRLKLATPTGIVQIRIDEKTVIDSQASLDKGSALMVWGKKTFILSDLKATKISKDTNPLPPPARKQPNR